MEPSETIKKRRLEMGLSQDDVYRATGLSWNEYFDIELHASEALTVAHLGKLKGICQLLELNLLDLAGVQCEFCKLGLSYSAAFLMPRNKQIKQRREERGLSRNELADRLGFHEIAVAEMEEKENFLEEWSVQLIQALSRELGIPLQVLFAYPCPTCKR